MSNKRDPLPLSQVLESLLSRLGVGDLDTWQRIRAEWADVAPSPWNAQAVPLSLTGGVLVVEAVTPAAVGVLRYGVSGLEKRLSERYGEGVVREVKLRSPGSRQRR